MVPEIIYGTAWKKEATAACVSAALKAGFTAVDTANQAKHYSEALVGEALDAFYKGGGKREELYLQTKFTSVDGQDSRLPYDAGADLATQVRQSFASSLEHLRTDYLDSFLLHGPMNFPDIGDEEFEIWRAMEELHAQGKAKSIGVSNFNPLQLKHLVDWAKTPPMTVQNRCFAARGWDRDVRAICEAEKIVYQGFSLLTANPQVVGHPRLMELARRRKKTPAQVVFRFSKAIGILPLTGTTDPRHMAEDLKSFDFELSAAEVQAIERGFGVKL